MSEVVLTKLNTVPYAVMCNKYPVSPEFVVGGIRTASFVAMLCIVVDRFEKLMKMYIHDAILFAADVSTFIWLLLKVLIMETYKYIKVYSNNVCII